MRFKLTFQMDGKKDENCIPISYQYELSSWIYRIIHSGDAASSAWLHNKGYTLGNKTFRLFTFSRLQLPKGSFEIKDDRMVLKNSNVILYISFLIDSAAEPFIIGLFNNREMSLGDHKSNAEFLVKTIERLSDPEFRETMGFRLLSPLVINSFDGKYGKYLRPDESGFEALFFRNLVNKYTASALFRGDPVHIDDVQKDPVTRFELLSEPKSKLVQIRTGTPQETNVRWFMFDFRITSPVELIKTGYDGGFGEKNSLGFGCGIVK